MATINIEFIERLKKANKLQTLQDVDGQNGQFDVREDSDQNVKFQEIVDLLVAAGYFRARIKGLSAFDKVVGGLTWCITSCHVDLDVDILFQENSTIGQKIALTEKIVAVLPKMNCPHAIEPHQIQGLDFIHIFPVIQWLVKKSVEYRREIAVSVRSYAIRQYVKEFDHSSEHNTKQAEILRHINCVREKYSLKRDSKQDPNNVTRPEIEITLLEYDNEDPTNSVTKATTDLEWSPDNIIALKDDNNYDHITNEDCTMIHDCYTSLRSELTGCSGISSEKAQLLSIEKYKTIISANCAQMDDEKQDLDNIVDCLERDLHDIESKYSEATKTLEELLLATQTNAGKCDEIKRLIIENNSLKQQEMTFREQCQQELQRLQNSIDELKEKPFENHTSNTADSIDTIVDEIKHLKLKLAKNNRKVAVLQRQLDDIPNRPEISQYQRRFLELYNQVAAKHKETKQYYTLYNTLHDTLQYLRKELTMLNSIVENYGDAMQSTSAKQEFLQQLQNIVLGIQQSKMKVTDKVSNEEQKRDNLSAKLSSLVELQRKYVTAVKQLSVECNHYESILSQKSQL